MDNVELPPVASELAPWGNGADVHSPLGASGAERWMECPGSVQLSVGCDDPESEYAREGSFAHALAAFCLADGSDAWQWIDKKVSLFEDMNVDVETADAVQVYLDAIRDWHPDRNQGNFFIERKFHCPSIHELFFGTADTVFYELADILEGGLHVWDYKHGAGIVVDVKHNAQLMYYGCGVLEHFDAWAEVDVVHLHIVQPRGFHFAGPVRHWSIATEELQIWLEDTLIPAMDHALVSRDTKSGDHCRFCPARAYACPQHESDMDELEKLMELIHGDDGAKDLTNDQVGRYLQLHRVSKIVAKAADKTAYSRLMAGKVIPGTKLVMGRTNREWKKGAEPALRKKYGKKAVESKLLSPAKTEGLIGGKAFAERWASKPAGDLTTAPETDSRRAVNIDNKSMFKDETKKGKE